MDKTSGLRLPRDYDVKKLLTGNSELGKAYFNGAGQCAKFGYYISAAPLVVKDKLLVGMSGDQLNMPGFLEARDLNDGKLVWRWDAIPKAGEPGSETWPNAEIMARAA